MQDREEPPAPPAAELASLRQRIAELQSENAALVKANERYLRLVDDSPCMIYRMSLPDGRYEYVSEGALQVTGYSPREILSSPLFIRRVIHPDFLSYIDDQWKRLLGGQADPSYEYMITDPAGGTRWLHQKNLLLRDADGRPSYLEAVVTDITDRKRAEEEARKNRLFLSELIEHSGALICVKDRDGRYELVNRKWEEVTGHERREVLGKTDEELFPGPVGRQFRLNDLEVMESGTVLEKEEILEDAQGKRYFISVKVPMRGDDGAVGGLCGMITEITTRKQTEEALGISRNRLSRAEIISRSGNWEFDLKSNLVFSSEGARRIYGLSDSTWTIPEVQKMALPEYRDMLNGALRDLIQGNRPYDVEFKIARPDTGEIVDIRSVAEYDRQREVVFGIIQDITEYKRAQSQREAALEALGKSESLIRAITDSAQDAILMMDPAGRISFWNPAAEQIFGYTNQEAIGRSLHQILAPERFWAAYHEAFGRFQASGQGKTTDKTIELQACRKGGEEFSIELSLSAIALEDGWHALGIIRDITARKQAEQALRESEGKYRFLAEKMSDIVWIADRELRTVYVTPSVKTVLGFTQEERLRQTIREQLTTEALSAFLEAMAGELADEAPGQEELKKVTTLVLEYHHKDGSTRWMETVLSAIRSDQGVLTGLHGVSRDVTERQRAEEAILLSAQRTQVLLQLGQMTEATLKEITDFALEEAVRLTQSQIGYLAFLNSDESVLTMHSWSKSAMAECAISDKPIHYPVVDTGLWGEAVRQRRPIITNDYSAPNPWKKSFPEGHVRVLRHMNVPVFAGNRIMIVAGVGNKQEAYTEADTQQLTLLMQGMLRLIERRHAEEELHESRRRLEDLIEFLPDATLVIDRQGKVIAWNRAIEAMTGVRKEEMLGKGNYEYALPFYGVRRPMLIDYALHPDEAMDRQYPTMQRAGDTISAESLPPSLPPGDIHTHATASVLHDSKGDVIAAIECIRDDTERKKLAERLNRAEKMEGLGRLAGGVAHDLNNILGVLVGYSELLREKLADSPLKKYAESTLQAGLRGAAIIQDLLTLARRGVAVSEVVDLNAIVSDYLKTPEFEKLRAEHREVKIRIELTDGLLNIKGSPIHLSKTLVNLVSNAAEAISGHGEIAIKTENRHLDVPVQGYDDMQEGDYAVLTVSDTGKGISPEDMGKIFEPFYTRKVMGRSGTGLGLAVVWGTVKDHRGYIDVLSEEGKGSTFTLYLPVCREGTPERATSVDSATYKGKGEAILVVDDVKEQRELAISMLERLGYKVEAAAGGEEAVGYLRSRKADLVVLDMIMEPGIDGLETFRRIREIAPRQKAIIVSGFSETDRVRKAQEMGAGAFVRKPYVLEKIGLAIRRELDRP